MDGLSTLLTEPITTLDATPIILEDALVCDDALLCDDTLPCRDGADVLDAVPIVGYAPPVSTVGLYPSALSFPGRTTFPGSGTAVITTPTYIPWEPLGATYIPRSDAQAAAITRLIPVRFPLKESGNAPFNAIAPPPGTQFSWSVDDTQTYWTRWQAYQRYVTGNFTGTTEEIMVWAAAKWGIDENWVRAVCVQETDWQQNDPGDFSGGHYHSFGITQVRDSGNGARFGADAVANGTTTVTAATGAFVAGDVGHNLGLVDPSGTTKYSFRIAARNSSTSITVDRAVPFSGSGLTWDVDTQGGWGGSFWTSTSTALALDFWGCYIRATVENVWYDGGPWLVPEGDHTMSGQVALHGLDYVLWGAVGSWFSGGWYDAGATNYINLVKSHLAGKVWEAYT